MRRREPAQIFFRLIVQRLAVGVGMGGVHQTMFNTEMLVQDLQQVQDHWWCSFRC
jgi:hypothetical protein